MRKQLFTPSVYTTYGAIPQLAAPVGTFSYWVNLDSYRNPGIEENGKEKRGGEEPMISPPVSRRAHAWHDAHIRICGEHVGRGRGDRSGQDVERSEVRVMRG